MRERTEADIRAAWANFRHDWDFSKQREVRIPLPPITPMPVVIEAPIEPVPPTKNYAIVRYERGTMDGKQAERLVGTIPDTDLEVVLEMRPCR